MNILIISHKFPPDSGVATFRVAKFAKYLTEFGCSVYVVAKQNDGTESADLLEDVQSVEKVIRTDVMSERIPLKPAIRWIKPLVQKATEMVDKYDIDAVFHSAPDRLPTFSCLPIQKQTGVPYIVDLRDPLAMRHEKKSPTTLKSRAYYKLTDLLERRVFRWASAVVLNNQKMYELYANEFPAHKDKMSVIANGYDTTDFEGIEPTQTEGLSIVFPGRFRDDMRWFLEPFAQLTKEQPDVSFRHFGRKDRDSTQKVRSVVDELGLNNHVTFEGYVERKTVFAATMGANLGVAAARPGDKTHAPTKIYDYMGCDVPILGVDEGESAMRDILADFPNAYTAERSDQASVYDVLDLIYKTRPTGLGNEEATKKYTRRNLARDLYDTIHAVTEDERPS